MPAGTCCLLSAVGDGRETGAPTGWVCPVAPSFGVCAISKSGIRDSPGSDRAAARDHARVAVSHNALRCAPIKATEFERGRAQGRREAERRTEALDTDWSESALKT